MSARSAAQDDSLILTGLLTDHAHDPLGIDETRPRFSWRLESDRRGVRQVQYRVTVDSGDGDAAWDSGWVESCSQLGIEYDGVPLASRTRYTWQVAVRTEDETEAVSEPASFETALLSTSEWSGEWLACVAMTAAVASPLLRREFELDGEVARARAYVSGLGYYELFLNGQRVGNSVLDPAWTDYRSRVLYSTYDITEFLRPGRNAVGISLGNGWFEATPSAVPSQLQPQAILELHIDLEDGRSVSVVTRRASEWMATIDGPIREHSIYGGETYDARREIAGWAEPGLAIDGADAQWRPAMPVEPPGGVLRAQTVEPIRVVDEVAPVTITRVGPDSQVVDFGQNFAGWVRIRLSGESGAEATVRHAELLGEDGAVNTVNLRTAAATDRYVQSGDGPQWFEPHFTYHGFRYVQIDGCTDELTSADVIGRVVRSSVTPIGRFGCSDPLLERIHRNVVWTEGSNLHGLPTDCPQRDERLAWLNDMTVRAEQAVHNFGLARLYTKWFADIVDTQGAATGAIADTAPHVRYGRRPADPVVSSFLLVPQLVHAHYGERRLIERGYENLARWVSFLESLRVDGIIEQSEIGDWAPPVGEAVEGSAGSGAMSATTPGGLISTGFLHLNLTLMAGFARVLNRPDEVRRYTEEAARVRDAINERYFDAAQAQYGPGNQASNSFALYLGIVPAEHEQDVLAALIQDIEEHDDHLTTGNICTKYVMDVLGRFGRADVAMRLLTQRTYPSWGYMVEMGATTIWERWEHVTGGVLAGMGSHNHPMYGAVDSWFYRFLGGISPTEEAPGFGAVLIEPVLPEGLDWAECELATVRGPLLSRWSREDGRVELDVTIPPNSTGSVLIPLGGGPPDDFEIREGGRLLWCDGSVVDAIDGIQAAVAEDDRIRVQLGSGAYRFRVSPRDGASQRLGEPALLPEPGCEKPERIE